MRGSERLHKRSISTESPKSRTRISWYVTRRLLDPFLAPIHGHIQTFMIDERRAREHPGVINATSVVSSYLGGDSAGIITTNYDLLIEYALTTSHFNYGISNELLTGRNRNPFFFSQGGPVYLKGSIPLAKLHGSVSWAPGTKYTDGRCGLKGNALIIPPRPEKQFPGELVEQVNLASSILGRTTHLLVFGFAFNRYDQALLELLASAGRSIEEIQIIDIVDRTAAAQQIWPNAKIRFSTPPTNSPDVVELKPIRSRPLAIAPTQQLDLF